MPSFHGKESVRLPSADDEGICSTSPTASTLTMITAAASTSSALAAIDPNQSQNVEQHSQKQQQKQQQENQSEKDNTVTVSETHESNQMRDVEPMEIEANGDQAAARRQVVKVPVSRSSPPK
jgi:hypothetical protein